jgi:hypothetical protein
MRRVASWVLVIVLAVGCSAVSAVGTASPDGGIPSGTTAAATGGGTTGGNMFDGSGRTDDASRSTGPGGATAAGGSIDGSLGSGDADASSGVGGLPGAAGKGGSGGSGGSSGSGGGFDLDANCGKIRQSTKRIPIDIYIMQNRSASMECPAK